MKRKLLAAALTVIMILSLLPAAALAADGDVAMIGDTGYESLTAAVAEANDGDTIKLMQDTETEPLTFNVGVTLDLGGKTLTLVKEASGGLSAMGLFFNNSSTNKLCNGTVLDARSSGTTYAGFISVRLSGGGSLTTEDVTIQNYQPDSDENYNYILRADGTTGSLTLNSGTVLEELERTTTNNTTYGAVGVAFYGGAATAETVYQQELSLTVNDGVTINTTGFAISGNGSKCNGTNITINGGEITSSGSLGIYHPQHGTLTVNGGTITGVTGIEMRAGNLIVEEGATITGTGDTVSVDQNGNGSTSSGVGITVAQHTTKFPINVTINGGTIAGASALYQANPQNNPEDAVEKVELSIAGGDFTATDATAGAKGAVYSENKTGFITGGSFSTDVSELVADSAKASEDGLTVTPLTAADEESVAVVDGTYYKSIQGAIDAAEAGATVELVKEEVVLSAENVAARNGAITIDKDIILDGKGATITAGTAFDISDEWGNTKIGHHHVINIMGGNVTIQNLTINGNWDGSEEDTNAARSGINVWTTGSDTATVNLNNVTVEANSVYGVVVNGTGSVVNATNLTVADSNRWGVNADQGGTFNLLSGDIGADFVVENSQGTSGKAVISDGTFTAAVKTQASGSYTVPANSLLINGGDFTGATLTEAAKDSIAITGGSFSTKDVSDFCATGYTIAQDGENYTVAPGSNVEAAILDENGNQLAAYSLRDALTNAETSGNDVLLLKDATLSQPIPSGVTLIVADDTSLTIDENNITALATSQGKIQVNAGGAVVRSTAVGQDTTTETLIGAADANIVLTGGNIQLSVDAASQELVLDFNAATAEVPEGHRWTLTMGGFNMKVTLDADTTLTVNGVTGDDPNARGGFHIAAGSSLDNDGRIVVNTVMTVSASGSVTGEGTIEVSGVLAVRNTAFSNKIKFISSGRVYSNAEIVEANLSGRYEELSNKTYDGTAYTHAWRYYVSGGGTVTPTPTPTPEPEGLPFTDVTEEQWFYDAVEYVYENGLMNGVTETTFEPDSTTTRGMIVTVLYRMAGSPAVTGENAFTDVEAGSWYEDAIIWAAANGIVEGYGDGTFFPDADVTREQMAAILYRYAEYAGLDVTGRGDLTAFPDGETVSAWAEENVAWAVAEGLLTGRDDQTLDPAGTATRAEIATILMRYCETVAK